MKDKVQELERDVQSNHPIKQLASHLLIFKLFFSSSIVNQFERQSTDVGEGSWPDQLIDPCLNCMSRSPTARIVKRVRMEFDLQKQTGLTIICIDNGHGTNELLKNIHILQSFAMKKRRKLLGLDLTVSSFFFSSLLHYILLSAEPNKKHSSCIAFDRHAVRSVEVDPI